MRDRVYRHQPCNFGLVFNRGKLRGRTCPFCKKKYELKKERDLAWIEEVQE